MSRIPIYVNGHRLGDVVDGVWEQKILDKHIYRRFNAKGMDLALYRALQGKCRLWRLIHKKTGQVLSIPFDKIKEVGFEEDTGAGRQIFVFLSDFKEEQPALQGQLF